MVTFTWEEPVFTLDTTPSGLTVAADSSLLLQVISASAGTHGGLDGGGLPGEG